MSNLHKRLQMSRLPPMPPKFSSRGGGGGKKKGGAFRRDYAPVAWDKYFTHSQDVRVDANNTFRTYHSGEEGPVCMFLHGGGFSALSWALLSDMLTSSVKCRVVAMDMRGHGDSVNADEDDLSADQLANDVASVVSGLYTDDPPPIILIGHSMGGAIAVHTASQGLIPSLIGLIVIDVVEGTAMEALSSMQSFLQSRPKTFKSVDFAVEWCVRSGQVRNLESAKVSMVGQVKRIMDNQTATSELAQAEISETTEGVLVENPNVIREEDEEDSTASDSVQNSRHTEAAESQHTQSSQSSNSSNQYTWRVNLSGTEKHWPGWFQGLSVKFLSCNVPKMLILAGVDRLDRELTVGQMQGKFQMQVLPQCGHAVHEDNPEKVADVLATFMVRNKFAEAGDNFERVFPSC